MHIEVDNHATDKLQDMEFNNYITLRMALNMIKKQTMSCRFFLSRRATLKHTGYSVPMSRDLNIRKLTVTTLKHLTLVCI